MSSVMNWLRTKGEAALEYTLWLHESAAGSSIEPMDIRLERSFEESRNLIFSGSFLILILILLLIKDYD